jgi:pimeloyl-ACP methyl ester carboxylesterase
MKLRHSSAPDLDAGIITRWIEMRDGVRLCAELAGAGPALLVLGGIGSGIVTRMPVAGLLARRMRFVNFDRRASGRSSGGRGQDLDIAEAVQDALAVLDAYEIDQTAVFAACAGASIGLELLRAAPHRVSKLVVHEPVLTGLLTDAGHRAMYERYHALFHRSGAADAMHAFLQDHGLPYPDLFRRACRRDGAQWFGHDYWPLLGYRPDAATLRLHRNRVSVLAGEVSVAEQRGYAQVAARLADITGIPMTVIPGHHSVYFSAPELFARVLCDELSKQ